MSKKIYLFSLVLLTLAFVSCSETEEVGKYDNWRARNEAYIDSLANVYATASGRGGLERIEMLTARGNYIYYKEIEKAPAANTDSPKYTDYVKVYYKGTNILGEYFDGNFKGDNPVVNEENPSEGDSPTSIFQVSGVITGWGEVLQRMKVGDRWKVYIPWEYAYGSSGTTGILGYSALVFDITLLDFATTEAELK
ncbi:FKBP-type peptidyl-prolyl cis-trans isomerase [Bacteroides faecis]|jgi:peptidyl-prolyl cis-trans isomerase|uniref:FKBP-type peptidyl-prolyl cis-trans isomerase n=1 Tax=Bacteroides faecis TaxID=674529 RepID=UPI000D651638|nr:FKBP-type peptidyl-prolyl cis-trans isomerase [Bacteroides faecis]KAA5269650.1 peptidylprolyl isomerase [Bacteroides faecis]MCE9008294.1 FKBP-type peptidyl-prolyl cis-trans isomerase [Bacteroides faecis]MCS2651132.1 FKBP-type peptidyl-prolyl cis-trans isomerase [Bacteroides faecis]RYT89416.1 peptidylprolyl isomerase [Bacteroides faecis]UYU55987.1 FKBP-type peptidyl-prolyl cis-trans isomerase [Bacteroides faecis]